MKSSLDFNFGDSRLNCRGNEFIESINEKNSVIIHKISNGWNEEMAYGRFLNNEKVTSEELIKAVSSSVGNAVEGKHVLILEDSSELNYTAKEKRIKDLGKVAKGLDSGFEMHPNLVIDATDGSIIGISDIHTWKRKKTKLTQKQLRKSSYLDKESGRWITSAQNSISVCNKAQMRTVVGDREADMYDLFNNLVDTTKGNHVVIRSQYNRVLYDENINLFEYIDNLPVKGIYEVDLPKTDDRSAHTARLEVRYTKAKIQRPKEFWDKSAPKFIELNVVDVREQSESVVNNEKPIHWRLHTSHEVENVITARLVIDWYCNRWWIEQLFRTIKKKGLRIEDSQVESYERLVKLVILAMIASVRALQLTKARDGDTSQKLTIVFCSEEIVILMALCREYEGKTKKLKNPHSIENLAYGSWVIARLGGWKGYASQGPAGPITMLEGLKKFSSVVQGWNLCSGK